MIAAPARLTAPARPAAASRAASSESTPSAPADAVGFEAQIESQIAALLAQQPTPQEQALARQSEAFDFVAKVQAEQQREMNALRDASMKQMQFEDELLKKWIELI